MLYKKLAAGAMLAAALSFIAYSAPAQAQSIFDVIKDTAKDTVKDQAREQTRRAVNSTIECAIGDQKCVEKARKQGKKVVMVKQPQKSRLGLYETLSQRGRVVLQSIIFDTGTAHIHPASRPKLRKIGKMLQTRQNMMLLIQGHTDNRGSAKDNMALSKARADAVRLYLIDHFNIDSNRLRTMGFGGRRPIADNSTIDGRYKNQRIELVKL